jgi:hypothetical protein
MQLVQFFPIIASALQYKFQTKEQVKTGAKVGRISQIAKFIFKVYQDIKENGIFPWFVFPKRLILTLF